MSLSFCGFQLTASSLTGFGFSPPATFSCRLPQNGSHRSTKGRLILLAESSKPPNN
jgi:hypothetical protein